eukprot:2303084-Pyramimonas_sp.AAC.1
MWKDYTAWPHQKKERSAVPILVFYRARQGHSTSVASVERMHVPYDPGQARSHGPLLHTADSQTLLESTVGKVQFPKRDSGL